MQLIGLSIKRRDGRAGLRDRAIGSASVADDTEILCEREKAEGIEGTGIESA